MNEPSSPVPGGEVSNALGATAARRATGVGALAIVIWASLAPLTALSGAVPPFQMVALSFFLAGTIALMVARAKGERISAHMRHPPGAWVLGVGGLFGYHFLVFLALKTAPALEANLINYLWPLLIVLFSALLPGERLRWWHVAGALCGLGGTVLIVGAKTGAALDNRAWFGYGAALAAAVTWAGYSVLNRRFAHVPTSAVGPFLIVAGALATICHIFWEPTIWPQDALQWGAIIGLGLGPAGGAFFVWDYGVKHGDIRVLGALAYGAPLMSTALLIVLGKGDLSTRISVAGVMIVGGAALASREMFFRRT
ncbi:aromatic amino acid exporter YddG [Varunaivibrio sulfuroxidans]|uniref:Drug/metabolite transporter (DMT)-like permease n=1 Tax=Varunaivibrio sulfuroxidans TaxID=1773489 RepID=A0A4R3J8B1_9PROT|nr:EamA family transporter [Varunaivibrio sulfuroxidans]TCS61712.1 drug/metabolite transporter (DMT)-like permease [Varunaivibrio sulfuroxidans]WES32104.1 EamA family transporter [Varunaivibrio sulfuroxidans]